MGRFFFIHKSSKRHYIELLSMKTVTKTGKIQKISGEVREESVEAI